VYNASSRNVAVQELVIGKVQKLAGLSVEIDQKLLEENDRIKLCDLLDACNTVRQLST
jgi:hypothetical protein